MKRVFKSMLFVVLILPATLSAFGMGLSIPFGTTVEHENSGSSDYYGTWEEDSIIGLGLVTDTNIGKNRLYNWRFNLESSNLEDEYGNEFDRLSIVNTFGFALVRNKVVRFFMGPRINIGFEDRPNGGSGVEFSVAPVAGVNINLGPVVSLGLDLDYKIPGLAVSAGDYDCAYGNCDYAEDLSGATARFYLLFRFGERYYY